jgi:hypothetical protein
VLLCVQLLPSRKADLARAPRRPRLPHASLHTDNIIKGFAMAISILLSWLLSIPLFGLRPTPFFVVGLAMVLASVVLFSAASAPPARGAGGAAHNTHAASAPRPRRVSMSEHSEHARCVAPRSRECLQLAPIIAPAHASLAAARCLPHSAHGKAEGDNVVLSALLAGIAVGLAAGVFSHSLQAGGTGWAPAAALQLAL